MWKTFMVFNSKPLFVSIYVGKNPFFRNQKIILFQIQRVFHKKQQINRLWKTIHWNSNS